MYKNPKFNYIKYDPCHTRTRGPSSEAVMNVNAEVKICKEANPHSFNYDLSLKIFLYNLVRLREDAHFTQQDMASLISTSYRNYQRLEKGEAEFSFSQIFKISRILNCEVGDLYYFTKLQTPKFIELEEKYVANELGLMDFVCFNDRFFHGFSKKDAGEKILDYALRDPFYINHPLPISIKDFDWEIYNKSCTEIIKQNNVLAKRKRGFAVKDKLLLLNLYNKIFRIDKPAFYCQYETQLLLDGDEQRVDVVLFVVRNINNQFSISGTIKR